MEQRDAMAALGANFLKFWDHWNSLPKETFIPHISDYLDHADVELQPYVAMMDMLSSSRMRVRLMGTVVVQILGEHTGTDPSYYAEEIRAKAAGTAWTAATHPCGYLVRRTMKAESGLLIDAHGLVVPILTDTPDCLTLISFNGVDGPNLGIAKKEQIVGVQTFGDPHWLDIGAGLPES